MNIGDCFTNEAAHRLRRHTWIVLSDPQIDVENVLIVNITSDLENYEHACLLYPNEHESVTKISCINYIDANVTTVAKLEEAVRLNRAHPRAQLRSEILIRVLQGAHISEDIKGKHRKLLRDQGLIE